MFFRCSGVTVGDNGGEEGASVGDDDTEDGGIAEGSNSRSGIGGVTKGLRVNLRSRRRSTALQVLSHELFLLHDLSLGNSLYHLNHDYTPPFNFTRDFSTQAHFNDELGESYCFEGTRSPFVLWVAL